MGAARNTDKEASADKNRKLELAEEQTVWAAERTLMAWIRTCMSMITFGFAISQFFDWVDKSSLSVGDFPARAFGSALIIIGTFTMVLAAIQHVQLLRRLGIGREHGIPRWTLALATAILLCLLGCFALVMVIWSLLA